MGISIKKLNNNNKPQELRLVRLNQRINEIRDILNDICCNIEEYDNSSERLILSKCLDELILEFMNGND